MFASATKVVIYQYCHHYRLTTGNKQLQHKENGTLEEGSKDQNTFFVLTAHRGLLFVKVPGCYLHPVLFVNRDELV